MFSVFRWLRLWYNTRSLTPPWRQLSPQPMETYDKGLPSLPDNVIYEIFSLLDTEALKSCSLTGQALSRSAKPFLHRTLHLTPRERPWLPKERNIPGDWNEFKGLPVLGKRGALRHVRHLSIFLGHNPLFPHDLKPHLRYLHALTNLRSLRTRWLDIPSFISQMEDYFGAFFETLHSLELEHPRGDCKQITYFICRFRNLRDLRIKGAQDYIHAIRNGGPHFDIETIPPFDGTLNLELETSDKGSQLLFDEIMTLPLNFRTLKLAWCSYTNSQILVDACAPNLDCVDFTWHSTGDTRISPLSFEHSPRFRKLDVTLFERTNTELFTTWLPGTLSTITSNLFTELVTRVTFTFHTMGEGEAGQWSSVDDMLNRLSIYEDVTLVVRPHAWAIDERFRELIEMYFPLMWESGKVVLEGPPLDMED